MEDHLEHQPRVCNQGSHVKCVHGWDVQVKEKHTEDVRGSERSYVMIHV